MSMNVLYKWDYSNDNLSIINSYNRLHNSNNEELIEYLIIADLKDSYNNIICDKISSKDGYYLTKLNCNYIFYEKRDEEVIKLYRYTIECVDNYCIEISVELDNIINLLAMFKDNKIALKKIINLLQNKILKYRDSNNSTILHKLAIKYCDEIHIVIRELLLNKKNRILLNIQDTKGDTAAILGVKYNNYKFVDELDDAGADLNIKNNEGFYINDD